MITEPVDHGDMKTIWRLIQSVLPIVVEILNTTVEYFQAILDESNAVDLAATSRHYRGDMAMLLNSSIVAIYDVISW